MAQLTSLHLSIPSSGMTSTPDHLNSEPVTLAPLYQPLHPTATVSFASDVEVIEYIPVRSSRMGEPDSPDLLQPGREFPFLLPGVTSHTRDRRLFRSRHRLMCSFHLLTPLMMRMFSTPTFPTLPGSGNRSRCWGRQ